MSFFPAPAAKFYRLFSVLVADKQPSYATVWWIPKGLTVGQLIICKTHIIMMGGIANSRGSYIRRLHNDSPDGFASSASPRDLA